jgi:hypothetical protein
MSGVKRHGVLFSRNGPLPWLYSWLSTTPSQAPMPEGFALLTLLNHCDALVDFTFATLTTSFDTVDSTTSSIPRASSPRKGAPFL